MNNDNLYSIEENEENNLTYNLEEDNETEDADEREAWKGDSAVTSRGRGSFAGLFIRVLSNPVDGWKALKRSRHSVEKFSMRCFYPLVLLASLSEFATLFYDPDVKPEDLIIPAIITFIVFVFGYFTALICSGLILPKETRQTFHTSFGKEYLMLNIATLALFYSLFNFFPIAGPILVFLPLWTIYIACKGVKLFRIPEEKNACSCVLISFAIIGCPVFWNWVFNDLFKNMY